MQKTALQLFAAAALSAFLAGCSDEPTRVEADSLATASRATQAPFHPARAGEQAVPDRYMVIFDESIQGVRQLAQQMVRTHDGTLHFVYEHAVRGFSATLAPGAVDALRSHPSVAYVEQVKVDMPTAVQTNPPWGLDRIDQRDRPLSGSYSYDYTGAGVNIYVIDSGIRKSHAEFGGRAVHGYTTISDGRGSEDCLGHGTRVAGVAGSSAYGVAKGATLYAVRIDDCTAGTPTDHVVAGIDWVTANRIRPAVINLSYGGGESSTKDTAARNATASGISFAFAAGNGGADEIADDACYSSPSRVAGVVTVSAVDQYDSKPSWANYGGCVTLFAPGVSIKTTDKDSDTDYATVSGTSFAAPHVAGVMAQYLQKFPSATPGDVRTTLIDQSTTGRLSSIGSQSPNRLLYSPLPTYLTLTAYIDGPGSVSTEGTHYWEAMPSGGDGSYSYQWRAYWIRSGAWETLGTAKSQSVYVIHDHGSFELYVTVTSAGRTVEDMQLVCNFISPTDFSCT